MRKRHPPFRRRKLAEKPVRLQIITSTVHAGMGTFTVLGFPDPDDSEVFYLEYATGGSVHVEDPEQVRGANLVLTDWLPRRSALRSRSR